MICIANHFIFFGSIPLTLVLLGRDGGFSTLCYSCGCACRQKVLKNFLAMAASAPKMGWYGYLKPLFKKGSKTAPQNYRPIFLLPLISKIIEKVIHDQTRSFLDKNNIIYRYQSGFRKPFPTNSCL